MTGMLLPGLAFHLHFHSAYIFMHWCCNAWVSNLLQRWAWFYLPSNCFLGVPHTIELNSLCVVVLETFTGHSVYSRNGSVWNVDVLRLPLCDCWQEGPLRAVWLYRNYWPAARGEILTAQELLWKIKRYVPERTTSTKPVFLWGTFPKPHPRNELPRNFRDKTYLVLFLS